MSSPEHKNVFTFEAPLWLNKTLVVFHSEESKVFNEEKRQIYFLLLPFSFGKLAVIAIFFVRVCYELMYNFLFLHLNRYDKLAQERVEEQVIYEVS